MTLETVFYTLGIICMSLSLILLGGLFILVFYIWRKVNNMHALIEKKIEEFTAHPVELASQIGATVVTQAVKKAKDFLKK